MSFLKYFIITVPLIFASVAFAQTSQTVTLSDSISIQPSQTVTVKMENTLQSIECQVNPNPKVDLSKVYMDFNSEGSTQHKLFSDTAGKITLKANNDDKDGFYFDGGDVIAGNDSSEIVTLDCHHIPLPNAN